VVAGEDSAVVEKKMEQLGLFQEVTEDISIILARADRDVIEVAEKGGDGKGDWRV
jgi:hypothetical protein